MIQKQHHPCACCRKPIGIGFLMCGAHWRQVDLHVQNKVYRTWGAVQRATAAGAAHTAALTEYLKARGEAIACVRAAQARDGVLINLQGETK